MGTVRLVPIESVAPGQKVAKDVTDRNGNLLCREGTELSAVLLERLKARNVTHVFVETEQEGLSPEQLAEERRKVEAALERMFERVVDQPHMGALKEAAREFLLSRLS